MRFQLNTESFTSSILHNFGTLGYYAMQSRLDLVLHELRTRGESYLSDGWLIHLKIKVEGKNRQYARMYLLDRKHWN